MCNIKKADLRNHFRMTNKLSMRSKEAYDQQVEAVQANPALSSMYGVKGISCLNVLEYFHVTDGLTPDLFDLTCSRVFCQKLLGK